MRVLFIGGTGMTGSFAVRELLANGHEVWLLHRTVSESPLVCGATQIPGDKANLSALRQSLADLNLDVVVHMVAFSKADADLLVETFAGIVPRAVVISSMDVYRAYGRLHRTEPGLPDDSPLREDAPLREKVSIHGEGYDKVAVERAARCDSRLPCTVLRYPAVYGPGDALHRLRRWVRRMDDRRPFILIGERQATWKFTHGYAENIAAALVLTIKNPAAEGRTYNVGDLMTPLWARWAASVGRAAGWSGHIRIIPDRHLPRHLAEDLDFRQNWDVDTTRIRQELGYREIVSPQQCLERAIAWERANQMRDDHLEAEYVAEDAAQ